MSWKEILKEEIPSPPKSRRNIPMTCENGHNFTMGETKMKKILGAPKYNNFSYRCPECGKKAEFV